jgi:NitT/TauT family transport system ATP-binding protein
MSTDASFIKIEQASYAYDDGVQAVSSVDWAIPAGSFHCLVGRSGCGKTTLLKLAAGLLTPTSGQIRIGGTVVDAPTREVGFVFQTASLLEWLSVLENVLLPISLRRKVEPVDREAAMELLVLAGIAEHADRYPRQLSGGQQSRAALARALVTNPPTLLMDEPFSALDAITREELQEDLLRLTTLRESTVLFVTHDIAEAVYLGDHVAVMECGRISFTSPVALVGRRDADMRYAPSFNARCQEIRGAMASPVGAAS